MRHPQAADPDERRRRFEAVYAANFGPMLGYVLRRTGSGDDAADVVAETFLTAWRRLDDVPPGDRARLWLYGVAAFASLAGTDRELLSLVAWEGLGHGEIASVLGCSRNAVRIRLHRARSRFAAALSREHEEPRSALATIPSGETP